MFGGIVSGRREVAGRRKVAAGIMFGGLREKTNETLQIYPPLLGSGGGRLLGCPRRVLSGAGGWRGPARLLYPLPVRVYVSFP